MQDVNHQRRFGVELELVSTTSRNELRLVIEHALRAAGYERDVVVEGYHGAEYSGYRNWTLEEDGSIMTISTHGTNVELVSPPLTWDDLDELEVVMEAIRPHVTINRSCGNHVHMELNRDAETLRNFFKLVVIREPILYSTQLSSRCSNSYCGAFYERPDVIIDIIDRMDRAARSRAPAAQVGRYHYSEGAGGTWAAALGP